MFDALRHDFRYAVRRLWRSPAFSVPAIGILALAIGVNAALFSLMNGIVLRTLPVKDPQRLALISVLDKQGQQPRLIYYDTFSRFRSTQHAFESLSLYSGGGMPTLEARGVLVPGLIEAGTPEYYDVLGVRPFLGRFISSDDDPPGRQGSAVVVVGYRFWHRQFGGDPHAIGETLKADGMPLTIVGVTPPDFPGLQADAGADFSVPMWVLRRLAGDPKRPIRGWNVIGRMRQGVTLDEARAETSTIWPAIQRETIPAGFTPREQAEMRLQQVRVESGSGGFSTLRNRYANPLVILLVLTLVLLTIACVNLSGLLLARAAAGEQQLAICSALGASRARLAQQVVLESVMLSGAGAAVALPLAWWTTRSIGAVLWTAATPLARPLTPDARVLAATAGVAIATGLIISALPAWMTSHTPLRVGLQSTRGHATRRWGRMLLVMQVALSLALVFGAALLTRSLKNLRATDLGFNTKNLLFTRVIGQPGGYADFDESTYYPELVRHVALVPGATSVALSHMFPALLSFENDKRFLEPIARAGDPATSAAVPALVDELSPNFFATMGIPLIDGRDFTWHDDAHSPPIAIVDAGLARRLYPSAKAVGQRIQVRTDPNERAIEIVGVVGEANFGHIRSGHVPIVFRPMLQEPKLARIPMVSIRTSGSPIALTDPLQRTVVSLGREYVRDVWTMDDFIARTLVQERLIATLSSFFAALAVALASIGLYGLLAYAVARRTREIGVRMAVGASRSTVVRMIVREGVTLTLAGVVIGIPCALGAGRLTGALLFGLSPSEPVALSLAAMLLVCVGFVAGLLPAYRAALVDPLTALRCD